MGRKKSPEKLAIEIEQNRWNKALRDLKFCPEPTYQYDVDSNVKVGNHESIKIVGKYFDGRLYKVEFDVEEQDSIGRKTGNIVRDYNYYLWFQLRPVATTKESFIRNQDVRLHFMHMMVDSIFSKKYFFGIDMDPDYQRGYVWTQEDKEKLIDSIFNNVDIGKFVFVHRRNYSDPDSPLYEVLDGKQRITALCEFYENKFPYKGKYYNDLSDRDKWHFCDYSVNVAEVEQADKATILKYFLMINTGGKAISEEHLHKVRKLYENEVNKLL